MSGNTYCSDADSNTTQRDTAADGQQSLTWNDLGQLSAVTTASAGSSYTYAADNPITGSDPTGLMYATPGGAGCGIQACLTGGFNNVSNTSSSTTTKKAGTSTSPTPLQ